MKIWTLGIFNLRRKEISHSVQLVGNATFEPLVQVSVNKGFVN